MTLDDLGNLGELIAAVATVLTLIYLAIQIRTSNRLARAEASRLPNSDLNALNATFGTNPLYISGMRKILLEATREGLEPDERSVVDHYLLSLTNIQEQLVREIREGILDQDALDFGGAALFRSQYYRTSWPLYCGYLSKKFVEEFEVQYELDSTSDVVV